MRFWTSFAWKLTQQPNKRLGPPTACVSGRRCMTRGFGTGGGGMGKLSCTESSSESTQTPHQRARKPSKVIVCCFPPATAGFWGCKASEQGSNLAVQTNGTNCALPSFFEGSLLGVALKRETTSKQSRGVPNLETTRHNN